MNCRCTVSFDAVSCFTGTSIIFSWILNDLPEFATSDWDAARSSSWSEKSGWNPGRVWTGWINFWSLSLSRSVTSYWTSKLGVWDSRRPPIKTALLFSACILVSWELKQSSKADGFQNNTYILDRDDAREFGLYLRAGRLSPIKSQVVHTYPSSITAMLGPGRPPPTGAESVPREPG